MSFRTCPSRPAPGALLGGAGRPVAEALDQDPGAADHLVAELGRLETNHEWYRQAPWSTWNPESVDASRKTDLTLTIRPETASEDAWFDYAALMEDGGLDIDVHFGWD